MLHKDAGLISFQLPHGLALDSAGKPIFFPLRLGFKVRAVTQARGKELSVDTSRKRYSLNKYNYSSILCRLLVIADSADSRYPSNFLQMFSQWIPVALHIDLQSE